MIKNQAFSGFPFLLIDKTSNEAITTGTPTGYVTIDGTSQAELAGAITHSGNGQWQVNLTAAETDGDVLGLLFTHADAIPVHFTVKTWGTPLSVSAMNTALDLNSARLTNLDASVYANAALAIGAKEWPFILTETVGGSPIAGAEVWASSDSEGAVLIAAGTTDVAGTVTFTLNVGAYYFWCRKVGYYFDNPMTETVT